MIRTFPVTEVGGGGGGGSTTYNISTKNSGNFITLPLEQNFRSITIEEFYTMSAGKNGTVDLAETTASFLSDQEEYSQTGYSSVAVWSTVSPLLIARVLAASVGNASNALTFCGSTNTFQELAPQPNTNISEKWNGSAWATDIGWNCVSRSSAPGAFGDINAAFKVGGIYYQWNTTNICEKWNGFFWATTATLSAPATPRYRCIGIGNTSNGLVIGTYYDYATLLAHHEPVTTVDNVYCGTRLAQSNTTIVPGYDEYSYSHTEVNTTSRWNGTAWVTYSNPATLHYAGCGNVSTAIVFSSFTTSGTTEKWNTTVWATTTNLIGARKMLAGCGDYNNALAFGGAVGNNLDYNPVPYESNERWDGSLWSTAAAMNVKRFALTGVGNYNTSLSIGGTSGGNYNKAGTCLYNTEKYSTTTSSTLITSETTSLVGYYYITGGQIITKRLKTMIEPIDNIVVTESSYTNIENKGAVQISFNDGIDWSDEFSYDDKLINFKNTPSVIPGWTVTSTLNQTRYWGSGSGNANEALSFGGCSTNGGQLIPIIGSERWDGNAWTNTTALNKTRYGLAGCGTQDSTISFGGYETLNGYFGNTEKWNGAIWTTTSALNTARAFLAGCGDANDALSFGGSTATNTMVHNTEKWNDIIWATTSALPTEKANSSGCGNINEALSFGEGDTEKWNGVIWSTTSNLQVSRSYSAGCGETNNALSFGGYSGAYNNTTEQWGGSSWSTITSMNSSVSGLSGCGDVSNALGFGGTTSVIGYITTTERYAKELKYIKAKFNLPQYNYGYGVWAMRSPLNVVNSSLAGCGDYNNALAFGGNVGGLGYSARTEKWMNYSWATTTNMNVARGRLAGCGNVGEALSFGGYNTSNDNGMTTCEKWNGTIWTNSNSLPNVRFYLSGCGTANNALAIGGATASASTFTDVSIWNGSSWSVITPLNLAVCRSGSFGNVAYALSFGGSSSTESGPLSSCEKWADVAWSTTSSLNTVRFGIRGCGGINSGLSFCGNTGAYVGNTEKWIGSMWITTTSANVVRSDVGAAGDSDNALAFGGFNGVAVNNTERFITNPQLGYKIEINRN